MTGVLADSATIGAPSIEYSQLAPMLRHVVEAGDVKRPTTATNASQDGHSTG